MHITQNSRLLRDIVINILVNDSSNVKDFAAGRNESRIFRITLDNDHFCKELPTITNFQIIAKCKYKLHNAIFIHFRNYYVYDKLVFII